ncbi:MAG: hypothetical protein EBW55_12575, partial [Betaproteobacteria bacterium]|nr:hypothetical protein [Betaproteobacteria bacterium]
MVIPLGIVIGFGCALAGYVLHGGNPVVLWQPTEMLTIFGLSIGATISSNNSRTIKLMMHDLSAVFKGSKVNKVFLLDVLALMFELLNKIRKDGLMALEADIEEPENSEIFKKYPAVLDNHHLVEFLTDYLRMMLGGSLNLVQLEGLMEQELEEFVKTEHLASQALEYFQTALIAKPDLYNPALLSYLIFVALNKIYLCLIPNIFAIFFNIMHMSVSSL